MMIIILLIILIIVLKLREKKLNIDWKSFTKKGFKKLDSEFGLYLYTGKQGTGKTYSAIRFVEKMRNKNSVVLTNINSYAKATDCIYIQDFMEIIQFCIKEFEKPEEKRRKIIILFDEIFTCIEKAGALKKEFLSFLSQLRKRGIIMVSTAQEWAEINITLRRYCRFQIACDMKQIPFSKKAWCKNLINDGDGIRWDNDQQDFIAPLIQTNIFKGNVEIINKYDTFETIITTNALNKSKS